MPNNPTWLEPPPPQKKGLGCFGKGCLITIVAALLLLAVLLVGGFFTFRHVRNTYLASEPLPIPEVVASPEEVQTLKQQWKEFEQVAKHNESAPPAERQPAHLEFTAAQINQLISADEKARGHVSVGISNSVMQVQFSLPTDALRKAHMDVPGVSGRYLNGKFTVQTVGPTLPSQVVLSNATLNGRSVPASLFDTSYRGQSLRSYAGTYASKKGINTFQLVGDKVVLDSPGGQ